MILVLFENPSQRILPIYYVEATAELACVAGVATLQCGRAGVSDPGYSSVIVGRLCQTPLLTGADAESDAA
jgi:hypothetical protein